MSASGPMGPRTATEMLAEMGIKRRTRPRGPWRARPPGAFAVLSAHCRLMVAELENGKQLRLTVLFDKEGKITEDPAYVTEARAFSRPRLGGGSCRDVGSTAAVTLRNDLPLRE